MSVKWRLNVLMAERYLKNKDLTEATGMHPVTISKLKNSQEMPERLERATLEKLCAALNCQPGDLMLWEPDLETVETSDSTHQQSQNKHQGVSPNHSAIDLLDELPGQRLFKTPGEADQYLQDERGS
ncbi:helix-turn-helix domain-containing protein [Coleofasciculus sp. G2-EDA-02]|uniref:helix-turn-helix domain-containing protein n=1 Tax=Coleofasciculus sp. G2-EDA-02 TaxID=3069529 RepID=UPI0033042C6C